MSINWPFADPENVAVVTLARIIRGGAPILRVTHDLQDGTWQFLDGGDVSGDEPLLVALEEITRLDPSVFELADLPLDWVAERDHPGDPWRRAPAVTEEERDRKLISDIEEIGWHVLGIPEDADGPAFAFSVGLFKTFGHAEILMLGLDLDVMHTAINLIGEELRQGRRFSSGESASGFLEGYDVQFRNVDPDYYPAYLGYARWYYQGDDFPVLQCLWPDREGRFPADPGFTDSLRPLQPVLAAQRENGDDARNPEPRGHERALPQLPSADEEGHLG
jgi:hypothetical protein